MIKKILFLYVNSQGKQALTRCEPVFRAILRKFRVSPLFNSMQIDVSLSCRNSLTEFFTETAPKYDAIFLFSEKGSTSEEELFLKEIVNSSAVEIHTGGKVIVFPRAEFILEEKEGKVYESFISSSENINTALKTAFSLAEKRQHQIALTTPFEGNSLQSVFEEFSAKTVHIKTEFIPFNEIISLCVNTHPAFDVILTTSLAAGIIASHIDASKNQPFGYLVHHTGFGNIYCRKNSPYEEYDNSVFSSNIMAFSALLEGINMKSASDWLRRCMALAFAKFGGASYEHLTEQIITEIKKPIRTKR